MAKIYTIPNIITFIRIFLIPIILYLLFSENPNIVLIAGLLFIVSSISDYFDGYLARTLNQSSKLGTLLDPIADQLRSDFGAKIKVVDWMKVQNYLSDASTVINATSLGMDGKAELPIPLQGLKKNTLVTDIVYTPLNTPLLENAAKRGCRTVDGLGMLIHQAIPGFERWFGMKPDVSENLRKLLISQ